MSQLLPSSDTECQVGWRKALEDLRMGRREEPLLSLFSLLRRKILLRSPQQTAPQILLPGLDHANKLITGTERDSEPIQVHPGSR